MHTRAHTHRYTFKHAKTQTRASARKCTSANARTLARKHAQREKEEEQLLGRRRVERDSGRGLGLILGLWLGPIGIPSAAPARGCHRRSSSCLAGDLPVLLGPGRAGPGRADWKGS